MCSRALQRNPRKYKNWIWASYWLWKLNEAPVKLDHRIEVIAHEVLNHKHLRLQRFQWLLYQIKTPIPMSRRLLILTSSRMKESSNFRNGLRLRRTSFDWSMKTLNSGCRPRLSKLGKQSMRNSKQSTQLNIITWGNTKSSVGSAKHFK
jgi:hypothetical protein